ncbi:MAG: hypothetical protein MAG431_02097 [Chloroflexi bacterium]|nr:hypothetical protein [Chloroflexota bacterium]
MGQDVLRDWVLLRARENDTIGWELERFLSTFCIISKIRGKTSEVCRKRVRERGLVLSLPVVAMGLIPHIYQRAAFPQLGGPR